MEIWRQVCMTASPWRVATSSSVRESGAATDSVPDRIAVRPEYRRSHAEHPVLITLRTLRIAAHGGSPHSRRHMATVLGCLGEVKALAAYTDEPLSIMPDAALLKRLKSLAPDSHN
jgi:hypothetical protein